jgi:DNA-directed RNA polymerase subunit K/omega
MALKPIDLEFFNRPDKNVHECIVAASRRARQINEEIKIEFNQRVEMITVKTEGEGEENDINPDQLKISLEFEKRIKPTDSALTELITDKLGWRYREKEEPPKLAEEEAAPEETEEA